MNEMYNKDTIDAKFGTFHERFNSQDKVLDEILTQAKKTNGRVTGHDEEMKKINKILLIVGCVTATLLFTNGSQLFNFIMSILK